MSVMRTKL